MKKALLTFSFIATFLLLFSTPAFAQMGPGMMGWDNDSNSSASAQGSDESQNLSKVIQDIAKSQGATSENKIDCQKVSDDQLEKLGDAWMDVRHPDENVHQAMDQMMGGEGSASLKQAHIRMGQNYLGCYSQNWGSSGGRGYTSMMGWRFGVFGPLFGVVALVDSALLGILLLQKVRRK